MKRQITFQGVQFRLPTMPNFLLPVDTNRPHVPVGALTHDEVERLISEWASGFRDHVEAKRSPR